MNMGKKDRPVLRMKPVRSWESFSVGLIIGMAFAFIMFSVGYYTNA